MTPARQHHATWERIGRNSGTDASSRAGLKPTRAACIFQLQWQRTGDSWRWSQASSATNLGPRKRRVPLSSLTTRQRHIIAIHFMALRISARRFPKSGASALDP